MNRDSVVVDTTLWVEFLNRDSEAGRSVDRLVAENRAVITGPILYEVLQGARTEQESNLMLSSLLGLECIETTLQLWIKAGELSAGLRKKGVTLPISDVLIAAAAIENGLSVYTLDAHFRKIPHLKLYK